jgi:hypothetical protein
MSTDQNEELPIIYPLNKFTWDKETNCLISSILDCPANLRMLPDSFDVGFGVHSSKTGKIVMFKLINLRQDDDGLTLSWEYEPHGETIVNSSGVALNATIMNL